MSKTTTARQDFHQDAISSLMQGHHGGFEIRAQRAAEKKDNLWREFLNPLRELTMERIVQLVEQGERRAFTDLQWFY